MANHSDAIGVNCIVAADGPRADLEEGVAGDAPDEQAAAATGTVPSGRGVRVVVVEDTRSREATWEFGDRSVTNRDATQPPSGDGGCIVGGLAACPSGLRRRRDPLHLRP